MINILGKIKELFCKNNKHSYVNPLDYVDNLGEHQVLIGIPREVTDISYVVLSGNNYDMFYGVIIKDTLVNSCELRMYDLAYYDFKVEKIPDYDEWYNSIPSNSKKPTEYKFRNNKNVNRLKAKMRVLGGSDDLYEGLNNYLCDVFVEYANCEISIYITDTILVCIKENYKTDSKKLDYGRKILGNLGFVGVYD